jgi:hypothetical protein
VAAFVRRTIAAKFQATRRSAGEPLAIAGKKPLAIHGVRQRQHMGQVDDEARLVNAEYSIEIIRLDGRWRTEFPLEAADLGHLLRAPGEARFAAADSRFHEGGQLRAACQTSLLSITIPDMPNRTITAVIAVTTMASRPGARPRLGRL